MRFFSFKHFISKLTWILTLQRAELKPFYIYRMVCQPNPVYGVSPSTAGGQTYGREITLKIRMVWVGSTVDQTRKHLHNNTGTVTHSGFSFFSVKKQNKKKSNYMNILTWITWNVFRKGEFYTIFLNISQLFFHVSLILSFIFLVIISVSNLCTFLFMLLCILLIFIGNLWHF